MAISTIGLFVCTAIQFQIASADEAKVQMSAQVVAPTNLFVQVEFSGYTVPYSKVILYDILEDRIYIQQEQGTDGEFKLAFVLDRVADTEKQFELYATYKGLRTRALEFVFKPSTYIPDDTSELVLPPIIDTSRDEVQTGEEITLIGYACPDCNISFSILDPNGTTQQYSALTDDYGYSTVVLSSGLSAEGEHKISATVSRDSTLSQESETIVLKVTPGLGGQYGYLPGAFIFSDLNEFIASPIGKLAIIFSTILIASLLIQAVYNLWQIYLTMVTVLSRRKGGIAAVAANLVPQSASLPQASQLESEDYLLIARQGEDDMRAIRPDGRGIFNLDLEAGIYELNWHLHGYPNITSTLNLGAQTNLRLDKKEIKRTIATRTIKAQAPMIEQPTAIDIRTDEKTKEPVREKAPASPQRRSFSRQQSLARSRIEYKQKGFWLWNK